MPQPEVPDPAHADVDSMLTRKFGKEVQRLLKMWSFWTDENRQPTTSLVGFSRLLVTPKLISPRLSFE